MVRLNVIELMFIGGVTNQDGATTQMYIYNLSENNGEWKRGPELLQGRRLHACGIVKDSVTENVMVIVAGGERCGVRPSSLKLN